MAHLQSGEVFVDGQSVTGARLNNAINGGSILPGFIASLVAATPVLADFVPWGNAGGTTHNKVSLTNLFGVQVADAAAGVASLRTLGFTGNKAAPGAGTPQLATNNVFAGDVNIFKHIRGTSGASIAAGAGLGSGTATIGLNSSDLAGGFILAPAGTPASGTQATFTFAVAYATVPQVILVPYNDNAIAAQATTKAIRVGTVSTGSFTIVNTVALTAGTSYVYSYTVIGIGV